MKWMDHPGRVGPRPNAGAGQRRSKVPWRLVRGRGGKPRVAWGDGGRRVGSVVISWWDWTHGESLLARERVSGLARQVGPNWGTGVQVLSAGILVRVGGDVDLRRVLGINELQKKNSCQLEGSQDA